MTASIIILPMVRSERLTQPDATTFQITLHRREFARLLRRAEEWKMSPSEAAAGIIENELHRGRRKR